MLVTNRVLSLSLARAVTRTLCTAARERGERKPLYRRLSALGRNAEKVGETMDEWLKEGQPANQFDLMAIVKQLRTYKRNDIALQVQLPRCPLPPPAIDHIFSGFLKKSVQKTSF